MYAGCFKHLLSLMVVIVFYVKIDGICFNFLLTLLTHSCSNENLFSLNACLNLIGLITFYISKMECPRLHSTINTTE